MDKMQDVWSEEFMKSELFPKFYIVLNDSL